MKELGWGLLRSMDPEADRYYRYKNLSLLQLQPGHVTRLVYIAVGIHWKQINFNVGLRITAVGPLKLVKFNITIT